MTDSEVIKMFCESDKTIKKIFDDRKIMYSSNYEEDIELLNDLKNMGLQTYTIYLNFLTKNNLSNLVIRNYIFQFLKTPIFCNNVILENTTNDSNEAAKFHLQKIPFVLIAAESEYPFIDFMIEKCLTNDFLKFNKIIGFYIDCKVSTNKTIFANMEKYSTIFLIENEEVKILQKNDILKKWPYQRIDTGSKNKIFRGLYLTGRPEHISDKLLLSLKNTLNLSETFDELKELYENNKILLKNQDRENSPQILIPYVFEENDEEMVLNRFVFDYYFGIDKNKQKDFILDILKKSIYLIKTHSSEMVEFFNQDTDNNYHKIEKSKNSLIKFICEYNDLEFGTDVLFIPKNIKINTDLCFEKLDEFYLQCENIINDFFEKNEKI